jgi:hypothetical protein
MKIAFLNICHRDPEVVARVANILTANSHFDMYIHVDEKQDIEPFQKLLQDNQQVYFVENRQNVFWGGYHAINATLELLKMALDASKEYDYFCILQNLDYPIKSNSYIEDFFESYKGTEFIRGCKIAKTKDWHYARKYKIYNKRDDWFYINNKSKVKKLFHDCWLAIRSITTIGFNGVIKEEGNEYPIYYGAAQWAVTRECAKYMVEFEKKHPRFNQRMKHIQFPDEEYFHTIVHNSSFKNHCRQYDEPMRRWLVNWRNLHYYEYPKEITIFDENDYDRLIQQEDLFIRKVTTEKSSALMDKIDLLLEKA